MWIHTSIADLHHSQLNQMSPRSRSQSQNSRLSNAQTQADQVHLLAASQLQASKISQDCDVILDKSKLYSNRCIKHATAQLH
jgi:hypothetical protein